MFKVTQPVRTKSRFQLRGSVYRAHNPRMLLTTGSRYLLLLLPFMAQPWRIYLRLMNHVRKGLLSRKPVVTQTQAYSHCSRIAKVSGFQVRFLISYTDRMLELSGSSEGRQKRETTGWRVVSAGRSSFFTPWRESLEGAGLPGGRQWATMVQGSGSALCAGCTLQPCDVACFKCMGHCWPIAVGALSSLGRSQ